MFEYVLGKMKKTVSCHMTLPNPKDAVNEHEPMSCTAQGGGGEIKIFFIITKFPWQIYISQSEFKAKLKGW